MRIKVHTSFHHYLGRRPVDILLESSPRHIGRVEFLERLVLSRTLVSCRVLKTASEIVYCAKDWNRPTRHFSSVWPAEQAMPETSDCGSESGHVVMTWRRININAK